MQTILVYIIIKLWSNYAELAQIFQKDNWIPKSILLERIEMGYAIAVKYHFLL